MQRLGSAQPSVVVGIDGSRVAIGAALWAVDEAVSRDIPMRFVCAIDPLDKSGTKTEDETRALAAAETAVRYAVTAIEATHNPVKIEVEILQGLPTRALLEASRSADLICVGSMGLKHASQGRIGSTAAAVAECAPCPVAIIRGYDPRSAHPGCVVAEVVGSFASSGVLQHGVDEARLRNAPLLVMTSWQSRFTDVHDSHAIADGNRLAKADLDRRLAVWKTRHPDLDIQPVVVHGSTLNYLARNAAGIQLLVVGRERAYGVSDIVGPLGLAALHGTNCSLLICESQNVL